MVKRKNFLPTLLAALFFWANVIFIIFRLSPSSLFAICYWLLAIFLALFLTLSLIFANSRQGCLLALAITGFLILRLLKIAHFLNLFLFF
jgi:hypothetical protein